MKYKKGDKVAMLENSDYYVSYERYQALEQELKNQN